MTLEDLARQALAGDRDAVAELVRALQGDVYALALRMLWHREDAEDATQEIMVRVVTRLSQFDFESRLKTWVYRVATNYLLDVKKSPVERAKLSFASFADDLASDLSDEGPGRAERSLLTEEVKIGCTLAMLQCLDREHRLAYILGNVLELPADEAALALAIEPATHRKRLQRARRRIETFTRAHCGLVSDDAVCRCHRRVPAAIRLGRAREGTFADTPRSFDEAKALVRRLDESRWALELFRSSSPTMTTIDFSRCVIAALDGRSRLV